MSFNPVESLISPIDVFKNMCCDETFLMFEGMTDFRLSVHSAHLFRMNTVPMFDKPWPNFLRLFTTICDPIFANMVIDNSIWLKPG